MAKYFTMSRGLRGCYMPDSEPVVLMCKTRRELKAAIIDESEMVDSGEGRTQGFAKRTIAAFAALCWREAHKKNPAYLPYALPYKEPAESQYHNAIFISVASRGDYLEHAAKDD